ncbi:MAG: dicarboxylate/amino acid:cation symporter [Holosporales bacterium]|jgi:Na+/H+-dicarboxylate symporter|nr:dicarboxylate/amino acid:cation symporter [Holosporales bacterium]
MKLGNGYITLFFATSAVFVGFFLPAIGTMFKPFANVFLTFLSISIIPIIFSSVTLSIMNLVSGKSEKIKISRIVAVFSMALVVAGVIGILCSLVFNPSQSIAQSEFVSNMIFHEMQKSIAVVSINEPFNFMKNFNFGDFLATLLPKNPFEAFAKGNVIQILAISILIGVSVCFLSVRKQTRISGALSTLMDAFKAMLSISTKILPIGVFLLLSSSLAEISVDVLLSMKNFCLSAGIGFLIIITIGVIIMWLYSPIGLFRSIVALKESITIAFSTCSNQATLPFLTSSLTNKFNLPEKAVDLSIPLGVTMCRTSNAAYYAFVSVFIASLYNEPLSFLQYGFIVFGAILTSLAASGASGIIAITMISIILDPLNLPIGSIAVVLVVVEPIMDPIRTVTSLIMNAALSCAVVNMNKKRKDYETPN